jgi:dehydrogenase/reductase SDR family protein 7
VLCARREKELERVAIACRAVVAKQGHVDNVTVAVRVLDQLKFDTHGAFALDIERAYGKVDILVNNAGRSQRGSLLDTELEVYRGLLELNVLGVVSLTKAFMPVLAAHRGHIVSVGSCAGKIAAPMQGPYALSKFAVTGFMDTLRSEIGADGYTFTTICPGPVYSNGANAGFSTKVKVATRQEAKTAKKMNPGRYSELAVRAISNRVGESWICEQPVLFGMYAHQYTPNFAKMFMQSIGAKRVAMWKRGTDVNAISFKVYVKNFFGSLVGKSTKNE